LISFVRSPVLFASAVPLVGQGFLLEKSGKLAVSGLGSVKNSYANCKSPGGSRLQIALFSRFRDRLVVP
jgi:hypothetical protein